MKVIVIGAGITGPVLAMLLKQKGFDPVIYERHSGPLTGGLSMQLTGQVFKVLNILGLAEEAIALSQTLDRFIYKSELSGKVLAESSIFSVMRETTGWPVCAVVRSTYSKFVIENATKRGIPIHWGKKLVDVRQEGDKVTAIFEDGTTDEGDMLIGCDGIHSKVRDALFGKTPAEYTGLSAIGGFTPYTVELHPTPPYTGLQVVGEGAYMVCLPTAEGKYMWAMNLPGDEELKEDWRASNREKFSAVLETLPPLHWSGDIAKILQGAEEAIRFGLYLRPIPPVWHKGRVVLVGDAAHPTAPFLGQGANQSTEDIYHLVRMLVNYAPLNNESIEMAFTEYTNIRLPRVIKAIEQTKREGASRMAQTKEQIMAKEADMSKGIENDTWKVIIEMAQGPFVGESEI